MNNVIEESYSKAMSCIAESKIQTAKKAKQKRGLDEDAVVAPTTAPGGGEIAAPSTGTADVQPPTSGIKYDDVLGKCDHKHDGYLGPGCFHVPKRAGKLMRRVEILKKKKGQKNPYADNMKIMTDAEIKTLESLPYEESVKFLRNNYMHAKLNIHIDKIAYSEKQKVLVFKACYVIGKSRTIDGHFYMLGVYDGKNLSTGKFKSLGKMKKAEAAEMFKGDKLFVIWKNKG